MLTYAQSYVPQADYACPFPPGQSTMVVQEVTTTITRSPEYSSSPDHTSGSSPEVEHPEISQQAVPPFRKTRVVRTASGTLRPCSICGDLATGWHYDVLSCNGCKTFFRRTLLQKRKFVCTRGGNCQFTKDFRCSCRACRFEKCVQAGMNPKAIHYPGSGAESPEHLQMQVVPATISHLHHEDFEYTQKLKLMMHREKIVQQMRSTQFPIFPTDDLEAILRQPCLFGKHTFEQNHFLVQQEAYQTHPMIFWLVADLYLTIEYAKTFLCFQAMTEDDQKCLLAHVGGVVQVASQAYYSVLQESESVCFPDGTNALHAALKKQQPKYHESYYREMYCKPVSLIRQLKLSMEEFVLFKALALFSPDEIDLSKAAREDVARKRLDIVKYMRRLMVTKYGYQRGIEKLAECLFALPTFLQLAEKRKNYLLLSDLTRKFNVPALVRSIYLGQ